MALYYIVQLMHALWFAESRGLTYTSFDGLKSILVYKDSSLKLHDFSSTLDGNSQRARLEKIVHSCLLALKGHHHEGDHASLSKDLVRLQEDVKNPANNL